MKAIGIVTVLLGISLTLFAIPPVSLVALLAIAAGGTAIVVGSRMVRGPGGR
jgi:hypothetical protein